MTEVQATDAEPEDATSESASATEVHEAELPEAAEKAGEAPGGQIDILLDTSLSLSAQLGQAEIQVRQLLRLSPGSVVRLDRQVGEPVDLFLRGIRFATGELVVVGEHLGVRIKEILAAADDPEAS